MYLNLNKKTSLFIFSIFLFVILVTGCVPSVPVGPGPTNQTPIITSTPITTATVGAAYTYNLTATDPDGNTLTFSLTISPPGMTINSSSGLINWTPTAAGAYNVMVEVSDNGSPVKSITQSFTIHVGQPGPANQPPTITSTAITTATVGQAYSYDVEATDPDGDTLNYFLVAPPAGMTIDFLTGLITWTPTTSGNYYVTVSVSDGRLFATQSYTITVADSGTPLGQVQLTSPSDGTTLPPGDITFSWNPLSNATKYQFIIYYPLGQVALEVINIGTSLIVTFSAEETFTWKVRAGDNSANWGAWSNTWNLIIQSTTPVTYTITASAGLNGSISPSGSVTVNQGSNKSFTITPNSGYSIDDVLVDGSSVGAVSSYTFTNITQNHTISAAFKAEVNHAPVITSTPVTSATKNQAYTYDVNATDPDGDTLVYSLTTTPGGMSINSSTGLITWTPTAAGAYNVTVEVSDGALFATQSYTITVADSGAYAIGDIGPAGGLIFYDKGSYSNGWRYLEAAPASTEFTKKEWGIGCYFVGTGTGIGSGQSNTTKIVTFLNNNLDDSYGDVTYKTDRAAYLCDALTVGGYSDWFLPSKDELNLMYQNLHNIVIPVGGFADLGNWTYWSSSEYSEYSDTYAWSQFFYNGSHQGQHKYFTNQVRGVRAF